jgi:hypothetical protein
MNPQLQARSLRSAWWTRREFLRAISLAGGGLYALPGFGNQALRLQAIAEAGAWSVFRLQRASDLLSLHLELINLRVVSRKTKSGYAREVHLHGHDRRGLIVLHFPGQHIAEQAVWDRSNRKEGDAQGVDAPPPVTYPVALGSSHLDDDFAFLRRDRGVESPQGLAGAWISGPSQVVFEVGETQAPFNFDVDSILKLCAERLPLVVAPQVKPRDPRSPVAPPPDAPDVWLGHHPEEDVAPFTAVEFPTLLYVSPYSNAHWRLRPRTGTRRSELWALELEPPEAFRPGVPREQQLHGHLFAFAHRNFKEAAWPLPKPSSSVGGVGDNQKYSDAERPKTSLYEATRNLLVLQLAEDNGDITADRLRLAAPGATARERYKPLFEPPGDQPGNGEGQKAETVRVRLAAFLKGAAFFGLVVADDKKPVVEKAFHDQPALSREKLLPVLRTIVDPSNSSDKWESVAAAFLDPSSIMQPRGLLSEWIQKTEVGRDFFTKEAFAGFLMPFGFKAEVVTITERLPSTTHPAEAAVENTQNGQTGPGDPVDLAEQESSLIALLVARKFVRVKPWRNNLRIREFNSPESADFANWLGEAGRTAGLRRVEILVERTPVLANKGIVNPPDRAATELSAGNDYIVDTGSGENAAREVFWPRIETLSASEQGNLIRKLELYRFPVRVTYLDDSEETIHLPMLFVPTESQGRAFYPMTPRSHRAASVKEKVALAVPAPAALVVDRELGAGEDLKTYLPHLQQFVTDPNLQRLATDLKNAAPPSLDSSGAPERDPRSAAATANLLANSVNVFLDNVPSELNRRVTQFRDAVSKKIENDDTDEAVRQWFATVLHSADQAAILLETATRLTAWGMEEVGTVDAAAAADRLARILRIPPTINESALTRIGEAIGKLKDGAANLPPAARSAIEERLRRLGDALPKVDVPETAAYERALRELLIDWAIRLADSWKREEWDKVFAAAARAVDASTRRDILTAVFHKELQYQLLAGATVNLPEINAQVTMPWPSPEEIGRAIAPLQPKDLGEQLDPLLDTIRDQAVRDIAAVSRLLRGVEAALSDEGILRQRLHFIIEEYPRLDEGKRREKLESIIPNLKAQLLFAVAHLKDGPTRLSRFIRATLSAQDLVTHFENKLQGELTKMKQGLQSAVQKQIGGLDLDKTRGAVERIFASANPDRVKERLEEVVNLTGRRIGEELKDRLRRFQDDAAKRLKEVVSAANNKVLTLESRVDDTIGKLDHFFELAHSLAGRERALFEMVLAKSTGIRAKLDEFLRNPELKRDPGLYRWVQRTREIADDAAVSPRLLIMLDRFAADIEAARNLPQDAQRRLAQARREIRQQLLDDLCGIEEETGAVVKGGVEKFLKQADFLQAMASKLGGELAFRGARLAELKQELETKETQAVECLDNLLLAVAAVPATLEEAVGKIIQELLASLLDSPLATYLGKNWTTVQEKLGEFRRYVGEVEDFSKALGQLGTDVQDEARKLYNDHIQKAAENIAKAFQQELEGKVLQVEGEVFGMVKRALVALPSPTMLTNFADQTGKAVHEAREVIFSAAENLGENLRSFIAHPSLDGITVKLPGRDDFPEVKHAAEYLKNGLRDFDSAAGGVFAELKKGVQSLGEAAGIGTAAAQVEALSREAGAVAKEYQRQAQDYIRQARKVEHELLGDYEAAKEKVDALLKSPNASIDALYSTLLGNPPPKIFGVIPLDKLLNVCLNLTELPKAIPNNLGDRIETTRAINKRLKEKVDFALLVFEPLNNCDIRLEGNLVIYIPVPGRPPRPPTYSTRGQVRNFNLVIGTVIGVAFKSLTFVSENGSFQCTPKFGKGEEGGIMNAIEFMGPLEFVQTFATTVMSMLTGKLPFLLDFDGEIIFAKVIIALPTLGFGAVSIENLTLRLAVGLPVTSGKALSFKFEVSDKIETFKVSVCGFAGGGYFGLLMSTNPQEGSIEAAIEFGGALALNVGFAQGSLSVMAGIYFRKRGPEVVLQAYIRACGVITVLGFIEVSIVILLALSYQSDTGALAGEVSVTIRVKIGFFSKSFRLRYQKTIAGSKQAFFDFPAWEKEQHRLRGAEPEYLIAANGRLEGLGIPRLAKSKSPPPKPETQSARATYEAYKAAKVKRRKPRFTDVVAPADWAKHWNRFARGKHPIRCGRESGIYTVG